MHKHTKCIIFRYDFGHFGIFFKAPDIIYDITACFQCSFGNLGIICINRDWNIDVFLNFFDNRYNSLNLFIRTYRGKSGSRGFAAYIDDVGTFFNHLKRSFYSYIFINEHSAVGKRIGRHIQNSHHICVTRKIKYSVADFHFFYHFFSFRARHPTEPGTTNS